MKTLLFSALSVCLVLMLGTTLYGQINVTGGQTAQQLAEYLAGPNITVTNAVLSEGNTVLSGAASSVAAGQFTGTNTSFGFDSGVILSSGNTVNEAPGPNNTASAGSNLNNSGTTQMDNIAGATTFDAITLEFDFLVESSFIQFNYVFASEEYPEFAPPNNSSFNDVFGFFISGLGITGEENIALVPLTTNPVSINNINGDPANPNNIYYNDNPSGQGDIQYDGYTTVLEASRGNLTPCEVYHLKLVISDAGDGVYSSAVFLQENSLIQGIVDVQTQTVNGDNIALEGCIPASFTFSYDDISNQDRIISFIVGGTAVNGVDYQFVDSSMTIVAGDTSATIYIDAFSDGITEGQEEIWIIYQPAPCGPVDTAFLFIEDAQPIDFTLDGTNLDCFDNNSGEILVNATGGFPPYSFEVTYPNGSTGTQTSNPMTGLEAGTYTVQVFDSYGCEAEALVIGGVFDADTTFLPDVPNGQVITYDAPLNITGFNSGQTIANVSQIQQICATMEHSYLGDLMITVEAPSGEIVILKQQNGGGSCDLGEPIATGPVDGQAGSQLTDPGEGYEYCFNANPVYLTMVQESNNFTRNYTDLMGNSYTDNYLPAGSFTSFESFNNLVGADMNGTWQMHVTDQFALDNGYIFNWYISLIGDMPDTLVTLTQPTEIVTTGFVTNSTCGGSDGSISINIQDAVAPYTVSWSSGQTTENITGIPAGTYTVTVTDANGCQSIETYLVNNVGSLSISSTSTSASCYGGNDGMIDITPAGGQTPYTFVWDSGPTSEDISGLSAGNYTVTMQDQQGCIISEVITVTQATQIVVNAVNVQDEECNTDNGLIDIDVTGGTGSYGYQWSNGPITQDLSGLTAGTYAVDVIDGNGCVANASYTLVNDVSNCSAFCFIELEANAITNEICGNSNGSIDINVLNAVAPVSYSWSNGATTEDISNLSAGSYTVVATDANNCSEVMTFTLVNNTGNLMISNVTVGEENCGNLNGSINITVTGGAMPYTYNWSNGPTSEDQIGLSSGTYDVTVTDGNGCITSASYIVVNNAGTLSATASIVPELCTSSNGSINQTLTGGNGALTYSWDSGQTTQDISGLSTGTYVCTITDQTGCYIIETYTVSQSSGDISLVGSNITNEVCGNGQGAVNITLTGQNQTYLWSNGATTEDISGIPAGDYFCVVTNGQGCTYTTPIFSVINASGTLTVAIQLVTDEVCGNANGSINMNVSGGTAPYSITWSNGSTNEDLIGLTAGTYTMTVTDMNGCTESHSVTVGANSGTLAIQNAIVTDETCSDGTGAIDVIVVGGTGPMSYTWSNGPTSEDQTGLSAGAYNIIVTDQNGCTANETYVVNNQASGLTFTAAITNEVCTNGQGEITLTVTGGNAPYNYVWSNSGTIATINGLSSGVYSCTITDNTGCSIVTGNLSVGNTASGMSASTTVVDATCGNNGSIDLTILGGTNPISYSWSNGPTTEDISSLSQGTYTYTVTDANGCQLIGSADVIETNGNITYSFATSSETCGNGLGSIDLTPAGGQGPYTFVWSNGPTTEDLTGLSAGTYTCDITDQNGCSVTTAGIQVTNLPGNMSIANVLVTDETCSNGLGNIDITVAGGQTPITYSWSNGSTSEDISNLSSGTYTVTVTDGNGCQANAQAVVNSASGAMAITQPIITNENCSNGQGAIDITLTGAALPVSYQWSNGSTIQDLTGLSAGSYSVTAIDNNGCTVNASYTVTNSGASLAIQGVSITDEYCGSGSGSISITMTGGSAPYNYSWSNGGTTSMINNLSAGSYTVTVMGASGCQAQGSYTVVNNPGNLVVTGNVTDENCGDSAGAIDVTTTGGNMPLSFMWDSGQTTEDLSNLSAGPYNLTVTDDYGCAANFNGTVNNISGGLSVTITSVTDEGCGSGNGAIDATITGGGIISTVWDSGQTTEDISGLNAGTYTLIVTNNVGCSASATATVVNQTGSLAISFTNVGDENCLDGQGFVDIEVTGTPAYTYSWDNAQTSQDAIGLSAGTYTVTITDGVGCQLVQSFTVNNVNSTNITASGVVVDATCTQPDGEIDLTVNGGIGPFNFSWDNGDNTEDITNLPPGDYVVTITDAANCQVSQTITVDSQSSGLGFTNLNISPETCTAQDGQIVFFTGGTADDYYLDGVNLGGWQANNLSAGTYLVAITDNFGCYADSVVIVDNVQSNLGFTNLTITDEFCGQGDGEIVFFTGGTADDYYLDGVNLGGWTASGLSAGTYLVAITDNDGCYADSVVTVGASGLFTITEVSVGENCSQSDGSIDITVSPAGTYTYVWDSGQTTEDLTGIGAGTYTVTVTNTAGQNCSVDLTVTIDNTNTFDITGVTTDEYCGGANGTIDQTIVSGTGITFSWSNGPTTEDISGLIAGTYTCTVTDGSGCLSNFDYIVGGTANGMTTSSAIIDDACNSGVGAIDITMSGGNGSFSYSWDNAATTEDLSGLTAGTYIITITDLADNCTMLDTFVVNNVNTVFNGSGIVTDATSSSSLDGAIDITLSGATTYTYNWDNGETTDDLTGLNPGTYTLTVTSAEGCDTTMTFEVLNTASLDEDVFFDISMSIHPNPVKGVFYITYDLPNGLDGEILITDALGKLIRKVSITGEDQLLLDSEVFADGIYFVTLRSRNVSKMERVVITND